MALRSRQERDAAAAAMKARLTGLRAEPPAEIPAYVSAQRISRMLDCSEDHAHKLFGSLPGAINIATGAKRACWRYPMCEVDRELERLRCTP